MNAFWDVVTITILLFATGSGLWTIHRNHRFFSAFDLHNLCSGRVDALLYVWNLLSTVVCFLDAIARILWVLEVGWDNTGTKWNIIWLAIHAAIGCIASGQHLITNVLLDNDEFCKLCNRPVTEIGTNHPGHR